MEKDGTRSKKVLTAFSLQVRELSYEYHFSKANVGCYKYDFLTKGIENKNVLKKHTPCEKFGKSCKLEEGTKLQMRTCCKNNGQFFDVKR